MDVGPAQQRAPAHSSERAGLIAEGLTEFLGLSEDRSDAPLDRPSFQHLQPLEARNRAGSRG